MSRRGKPPNLNPDERRGIQSIDVGANILKIVSTFPGSVSLKEISDVAGMPASKIHRYLSSFIRAGLIQQDVVSGRYDLGPEALQLGLAAISRLDIVETAVRHMSILTEEFGITSLLSVWAANGPTIIRWKRGTESIFTTLALGSTLPAVRSATGLAFLAYMPELMVQDQVKQSLKEAKKLKNAGPRTKKELNIALDEVRLQQHANVYGIFGAATPGLSAAAVPILDPQGEAAAVITLITGFTDLSDAKNGIVERLIEIGRAASVVRTT